MKVRKRRTKRGSATFSLTQTAALCGVPPARLAEWTDLGFIRSEGKGSRRVYHRDTFSDIVCLRNAYRAARSSALSTPDFGDEKLQRSSEFVPDVAEPSNERLALRIHVLFAMNPDVAYSTSALVERTGASEERVLDTASALARDGHITFIDGSWQTLEPRWRGIRLREQRIRVVRRKRMSAETSG